MKNKIIKFKKEKHKILALCALAFLAIIPQQSIAGSEDLQVKSVSRISHPAYSMGNMFDTTIQPFNVDYSRVMMYEWGRRGHSVEYTTVHPTYPSATLNGRHMIWGCIASSCVSATPANSTLQDLNLDNLSGQDAGLTDWASNTFAMPSSYEYQMVWSPYPGETNIIYALNSLNQKLVQYNVDTAVETEIISYGNYPSAGILGFTKDATTGNLGHKDEIVILKVFDEGCWQDAIRVYTDRDNNFANPTAISEKTPCSCDTRETWYAPMNVVHGATSPDGLYYAHYWGVFKNDFDGDSCYENLNADRHWRDDDMYSGQLGLTHVSWFGSNDWFIEGSENTRVFQTMGYHPELITEKIYQVLFNRTLAEIRNNDACPDCFTHNLLVSRSSAAIWYSYSTYGCTTSSDCASHWPYTTCGYGGYCMTGIINYGGMPMPTIAPDGLHLYFHGTNGKYTRDDKGECVNKPTMTNCSGMGNNWEGEGAYMAELTSQSDTTPPAAPSGLIVQ